MGSYVEKLIAELKNDNDTLENNASAFGDSEGSIFQAIAENEHVIDILTNIYGPFKKEQLNVV